FSGAEEIAGARKFFGWDYPPFELPADILDAWRDAGKAGIKARTDWEGRLARADAQLRSEFERRISGALPANFDAVITDYKKKLSTDK
ncbi:MAG: transketolase, partial [Mesorhizobium sp.]